MVMATLFPYNRTIGRREYAVRLVACIAVSAPVLVWRWHVVQAQQPTEALGFLAVLVIVLAVIQAQMIARLRDMHAPVVISALVFVPYLNAAAALALLLFPSGSLRPIAPAGIAADAASSARGASRRTFGP